MLYKLLVIGDTHSNTSNKLPRQICEYIKNADGVIHVGDFTSIEVLDYLLKIKGHQFIGVYGNADPLKIREKLPSEKIIEIGGKKIGIIHPATGGSENNTKRKVLEKFKNENADIILFGHTHHPLIEVVDNILLINPGKGYLEEVYFGPPTTIAIVKIGKKIHAKIKIIKF